MNQLELNKIVGSNIKKYRKLYKKNGVKMTQEKLAEAIDVSTSLISCLESNKISKGISINNLYKIAIVLDVPIDKFFEEENSDYIIILIYKYIIKFLIAVGYSI